MFRSLFILALFRLSLAAPFLLGYSSTQHFASAGIQHPEQSTTASLSHLLGRFNSDSTSSAQLPLHPDFASQPRPSLLLVVRAEVSSPRKTLTALAGALGGDRPTSFIARTGAFDDAENAVTVNQVADLKVSEKNAVVNVQLKEGESAQLIGAIKSLASRHSYMAVVWASRQDAGAADAAPADQPAAGADPAKPDAVNGNTADSASGADATKAHVMNPPEISSAGLSGLLVALIFLLIFVPGFLCLTRIASPETFDVMDSNDMKKKMQ
ncbi:unnamed protein product [Chondrus crispus]|uniref:Uncharacterized protein n=1 Tax=Chondrus crispus TaxID=2769 RepID=R7QB67_CHOCR|nr:unnamed protein product [Chondrus crispus]CDF34666.1 unnamed protein product [Chondrus crispus]|eukprot:XP_005714485.1 unnamed protein product [Chondrus crispus]